MEVVKPTSEYPRRTEFVQFNQLPKELRLQIWEDAVDDESTEPQILHFRAGPCADDAGKFGLECLNNEKVHRLRHVNREARSVCPAHLPSFNLGNHVCFLEGIFDGAAGYAVGDAFRAFGYRNFCSTYDTFYHDEDGEDGENSAWDDPDTFLTWNEPGGFSTNYIDLCEYSTNYNDSDGVENGANVEDEKPVVMEKWMTTLSNMKRVMVRAKEVVGNDGRTYGSTEWTDSPNFGMMEWMSTCINGWIVADEDATTLQALAVSDLDITETRHTFDVISRCHWELSACRFCFWNGERFQEEQASLRAPKKIEVESDPEKDLKLATRRMVVKVECWNDDFWNSDGPQPPCVSMAKIKSD